jgi:hypothetical protein
MNVYLQSSEENSINIMTCNFTRNLSNEKKKKKIVNCTTFFFFGKKKVETCVDGNASTFQ